MLYLWPLNHSSFGSILGTLLQSFFHLFLLLVIFSFISVDLHLWTFIPKRVMAIYKFGHLNDASLVLDEAGCTIAQYHGFQPASIL